VRLKNTMVKDIFFEVLLNFHHILRVHKFSI
jgi:hypothetical protein